MMELMKKLSVCLCLAAALAIAGCDGGGKGDDAVVVTDDPCAPAANPSCEPKVCELVDGTVGKCQWLSNGMCGCGKDCTGETQSWHVAIEQNDMLTNCRTTTDIPVDGASNCADAITAAWNLLNLIASCINPCCPPGSTITQGVSSCMIDNYFYANGSPAIRYQVDWTYECIPPPQDPCLRDMNPECKPADCRLADGTAGKCQWLENECTCGRGTPNPCETCSTDADCFGGLVCADAYNTWDDPATPNICTVPCWGNGVCPDGMLCDFTVSKYCQCDTCEDLVIVSDTTNTVDGTATTAVEITPIPTWWNPGTLGIPVAVWIWVTNPAQNQTTETHAFTKTFAWNHPVSAAVLKIAADNGYSVLINGIAVDESGGSLVDPTTTGTTFLSPVTYQVANTINTGMNTIDVSVTNNNKAHAWNPAGLRYNLTMFCLPPNPCVKCEDDAGCTGGLHCLDDDGAPSTAKVCTGLCGDFPTPSGCADGQTCDATTGTCRCDWCGEISNPTCVPTDCKTSDGVQGSCHPTPDGCLCTPPNPCEECVTDADCTGGLVCADAYNTWDDPATPNICTLPCWANGVCPDGMICDFSISKFCMCELCTPPPPQMAAWWPLDETAGPTSAEILNDLDGTWVNGPLPVAGMVAGALRMSGGYMQVPGSLLLDAGTGDFSVDAWIKYDADPPLAFCQDTILEYGSVQFGILWWSDQFEVRLPGGFHEHVPFVGGPDQWHFVALTLDRADPLGVRLYMDGVLMGAYSPAGVGSLSNSDDLFIGTNDSTNLCPFYGDIDEVEYFKRALTLQDIVDIYEAGGAGKCKDDTCAPDVTSPVLTCPRPVSILADWPDCEAEPLPASAVDNCDSNPVVTVSPSSLVGPAVYLVTYTATDLSGNVSTCQTEVHVVCDPCGGPSNLNCEPKECKLPDGSLGKCEIGAAGCGCTVAFRPIDLELSKTPSATVVEEGDVLMFNIQVRNASANTATGIEVSEVLPTGLTYAGLVGLSFGTFDGLTGLWSIASIPPYTHGSLVLYVAVNAGTGGTMLVNTAEVTAADQPDVDSTPNNGNLTEDDIADATIYANASTDLSLTKMASVATTPINTPFNYTLTLSNTSSVPATGVEVVDVLPTGLSFVSAVATAGSYDVATGVWAVPVLPASVSESLTITVSAPLTLAATNVLNIAEVTAAYQDDPDSFPGNGDTTEDDYAEVTVAVGGVIDLDLLVKSDTSTTAAVGDTVQFDIQLTNSGASPATGIVVDVTLPTGLNFVDFGASLGTYNAIAQTWDIDTLPEFTYINMILTATVDSSAAGQTINYPFEVVAANEVDVDSVPNNGPGEDDYVVTSLVVAP